MSICIHVKDIYAVFTHHAVSSLDIHMHAKIHELYKHSFAIHINENWYVCLHLRLMKHLMCIGLHPSICKYRGIWVWMRDWQFVCICFDPCLLFVLAALRQTIDDATHLSMRCCGRRINATRAAVQHNCFVGSDDGKLYIKWQVLKASIINIILNL